LVSDIKEEQKVKVFETKVLRRIFGLKRNEVAGGWIKLHNEEVHNLCSVPSIIRIIKSRRNGVFWVVTPCGSFKNRRFGGTWRLLHQGDKNR
jgi:hypothetical protein